MTEYTASDFICIKELPIYGKIIFKKLKYKINHRELINLIRNIFINRKKYIVSVLNEHMFNDSASISWNTINDLHCDIYISFNANEKYSINFDEYFSIKSDSDNRGQYYSTNFSL